MNKDNFEIESNLNELTVLRDEILKTRGKFEDKLWREAELSLDLKENLVRYTNVDLKNIAKILDINKVSSLKKDNLAERIATLAKEKLEVVFDLFDEERYKLLHNIVKNNGVLSLDNKFDLDKTIYFRDRSIAFPVLNKDKYNIVVPTEIQELISEKDNIAYYSKIKHNEEIIKLFWGMTYYYGVLTLEDFKILVKQYINYDIEDINIEKVLEDAAIYYEEFQFNGEYGFHIDVTDEEALLEVNKTNKNIEYKKLAKEDILKAATFDYIEKNSIYQEFYKFLTEVFEITDEEIEGLIVDLVFDARNNPNLEEIVEEFLSNFEFENDKELDFVVYNLLKFLNNTPQWVLKGHVPEEIVPKNTTVVKEEPKVGRNEPCPCGSGKKYKKCCASNVINLK